VPSGNTLDVSEGTLVPSAGAVVNYTEAVTATQITLNNSSFTDIISVNVTPKYQSSKLLVRWYIFFYLPGVSGNWNAIQGKLLRDSTAVYTDNYSLGGGAIYGTQAYMDHSTYSYLDEPNTTSQITYKMQMASYQGSISYFQYSGNESVLSVTEIAQ